MTLDELTPWLFARTTGGIRWGLERTEELLAGVDDPHRLFRSLLIGGTNGKGSVAALCAAGLRGGGAELRGGDGEMGRVGEWRSGGVGEGKRGEALRVGLYTSPHLVSFAERVRVDGIPVADHVLAGAAARLRPAIERTGASFFEATTAMAFLVFAEAEVDVAVVEVGLGGRLDATNVLSPMVTGITNIGLDHTEYLGATLEQIAAEKAGIFKAGVPALSAVEDVALAEILRRRAATVGAPFHDLGDLTTVHEVDTGVWGTRAVMGSRGWGEIELRIALPGAHQARNAALAAELLGALPPDVRPSIESMVDGFAAARWPGRLQVERLRGATWVFDVAHNPAGASALADALPRLDLPRPWVLVAGILADKGWREMLPPLITLSDHGVLAVPPTAPEGRRWDPENAAAWLRVQGLPATHPILDFENALRRAETLAPHGTIIVTGSVHTVGDAMKHLGIPSI